MGVEWYEEREAQLAAGIVRGGKQGHGLHEGKTETELASGRDAYGDASPNGCSLFVWMAVIVRSLLMRFVRCSFFILPRSFADTL